ncbi:hypothetical protein EV360DRAFT_69986 [Lentinula raphanica]|nr:hypothetical protein EV360DRAFT_69986 [Lentinula raphanica]
MDNERENEEEGSYKLAPTMHVTVPFRSVLPRMQAQTFYHGSFRPPNSSKDEETPSIRTRRYLYLQHPQEEEQGIRFFSTTMSHGNEHGGVRGRKRRSYDYQPMPMPSITELSIRPPAMGTTYTGSNQQQQYPRQQGRGGEESISSKKTKRRRENAMNMNMSMASNRTRPYPSYPSSFSFATKRFQSSEKVKRPTRLPSRTSVNTGSSHKYERACHASFPPLDSFSDDDKDPDSDDDNEACDSEDNEGEGKEKGVGEDEGEGSCYMYDTIMRVVTRHWRRNWNWRRGRHGQLPYRNAQLNSVRGSIGFGASKGLTNFPIEPQPQRSTPTFTQSHPTKDEHPDDDDKRRAGIQFTSLNELERCPIPSIPPPSRLNGFGATGGSQETYSTSLLNLHDDEEEGGGVGEDREERVVYDTATNACRDTINKRSRRRKEPHWPICIQPLTPSNRPLLLPPRDLFVNKAYKVLLDILRGGKRSRWCMGMGMDMEMGQWREEERVVGGTSDKGKAVNEPRPLDQSIICVNLCFLLC